MLGWMAREFFATSPALGFPIIALILFVTVFTGVVLFVMRRRPTSFELVAALPLEDDDG